MPVIRRGAPIKVPPLPRKAPIKVPPLPRKAPIKVLPLPRKAPIKVRPLPRKAPIKVRPSPLIQSWCERFVRMPEWSRAETLAGQIMRGRKMPHSHTYDYEVSVLNKIYRIEVQYSKLYVNPPKWSFNKPFGESGQSDFDILLLICLADPRFVNLYHCDAALTGLVFFAIPISEAKKYCYQGPRSQIEVPTNPRNARRLAAPLYRYQIGALELWQGRVFARPPYAAGEVDSKTRATD